MEDEKWCTYCKAPGGYEEGGLCTTCADRFRESAPNVRAPHGEADCVEVSTSRLDRVSRNRMTRATGNSES